MPVSITITVTEEEVETKLDFGQRLPTCYKASCYRMLRITVATVAKQNAPYLDRLS